MVRVPLNLNSTSLGEKLWPVAWKQPKILMLFKEKMEKCQ